MTQGFAPDQLSFSVSQLCTLYQGEQDFFSKFRALARRYKGVEDVAVLAAGERAMGQRPGIAFAPAPVRFLGEVVGELHLYFESESFHSRSPQQLVNFLAKQLGIAIQAAAVQASNAALQEHLEGIRAEIREHKLLERARGVIESQRLIPAGEGQRLMRKVSEQSGKKLKDVAQGIVAAANKNPWKFRREFWA
jgi:hypothetical protein